MIENSFHTVLCNNLINEILLFLIKAYINIFLESSLTSPRHEKQNESAQKAASGANKIPKS